MHEFGVPFQRSVVRLMLEDEAFAHRALEYLDQGFFSIEGLGWIFVRFREYWQKHYSPITSLVLREELRKCSPDKYALYSMEVEAIVAPGGVPEAEYIKQQLVQFLQVNWYAQAHHKSTELFQAAKYVESYDVMARALDKIRSIEFEKPKRQFFFEEAGDRQMERYARRNDLRRVPRGSGIDQLDKLANGGVQEGELWCVLAYQKRGKTTWLVNQAGRCTRLYRQPTLFLQLEGSGFQLGNKIDAWFTREQYTLVRMGEIRPDVYSDMLAEYHRLRSLLVVRTMNDWQITVDQIVQELAELKATKGFVPTTLIVDYMDLLRSRESGQKSETQHQVDAARDLKRLVNQRDVACWSAWQAQRMRPGADEVEHVLTSANMADAYAKSRIVDAYGSINATNREWNLGEMRVYWENHRDAPVNRLYRCKNDLSTMRMLEMSEEMIPPDPEQKS